MDEFRSLKKIKSVPYSFSCMDGDGLENYSSFTEEKKLLSFLIFCNLNDERTIEGKGHRDGHECFLCLSDKGMFSKVQKKFVDRFHIVKHLIRKFEDIRVRIMKSFDRNDPTKAKYYRQLKALSRLLIKRQDKKVFISKWTKWQFWLGVSHRKLKWWIVCFRSLTNYESPIFYYQEILQAFHDKGGHFL